MSKELTPEELAALNVEAEGLMAKAREALKVIETYDQERVDRLCQAVAAAVYPLKIWGELCDEAVDETHLGDKVTKRNKRNKIKLVLRDISRQRSVGIIEEDPEKGLVKYGKPAGVVCALKSVAERKGDKLFVSTSRSAVCYRDCTSYCINGIYCTDGTAVSCMSYT